MRYLDKLEDKFLFYGILSLIFLLPLIFTSLTQDNFLIKKTVFLTLTTFLFIIIVLKQKKIYQGFLFYPFLCFLLVCFFSLLNAKNIAVSLKELYSVLMIFIFYCVAVSVKQDWWERIFDFIIYTALIVCFYGIFQFFGIDFVDWERGFGPRVSSFLGNPNFLSGYLVSVIPLSLSGIFQPQRRIFYGISSLILIITLILTFTRGSILAFGVSFVFWLFLSGHFLKKRKLKNLSFILIPIFLVIFFVFFNPKISSVQQRIFKWATALEMIEEHPFLGVGIGGVKVNYALYQAQVKERFPLALQSTSESRIHNEYLQIGSETGLTGLGIFLWAIFLFFFRQFKKIKQKPKNIIWEIGITSCVFGILIDCVPNFPLHIVPTCFLLILYLGMSSFGANSFNFSKKIYPVLISILLCGCWFKFAYQEISADFHHRQAEIAIRESNLNEAIKEYKIAHKKDPTDGKMAYDLGMVYLQEQKVKDALFWFEESVKIRNYGEVYNNIGNCYYILNDMNKAKQNWEIALSLGLPEKKDEEILRKNLEILIKKEAK